MPKASNFPFITDDVLRENLDIAFDHLTELILLSESPKYNPVLKSSFRKTTIIYTASIIEAILLWFLKKKVKEVDLKRETKRFKIEKEIYQISDAEKIVLGKDVTTVEQIKFSKLNLADINTLCKENGIITDSIFKKVNKVRELRNKLHIGTLTVIEKDYSKKDLEFVFSVAREIKKLP
ncbi:MAG: hypothetical protein UY07_C0036G0007 [Parcubacteria group bacterium GW2011_GWA1_47_8]|nr:MAG: hypothetical protein UY07_C0036G0007 [Parcubacteria group bacterium GW2011_GWA1_47_8]KKW07542.1 MAG: hypothetical protein UY42_C0011G0021 [Parcubacteria group bacterium GW2011_GWA2_49_16]